MSMIFCPECGHEVSVNAAACPNCGRPIAPPVVEKKVVVAPPRRKETVPPWVWAIIGVLGVLLVVLAVMLLRDSDDANTNLNVNVAARRAANAELAARDRATTTTVPSTDAGTSSVPGQVTTVPGQTTTVPGTSSGTATAPAPDRGSVALSARVLPARGGAAQAARSVRFYLLERDVVSILGAANVEPIDGNDLEGSLGLAAVFPGRYPEFQSAAERAISRALKASGTTDGSGKASMSNIEPGSYYIFAVAKIGSDYALWNAPVSVVGGENQLQLSPQPVSVVERE